MKVLITGATGLVGKQIVALCHQAEIKVNYLTTSKEKLQKLTNCTGFYWNPKTNEIDLSCFEEVDVIINLVGASIAKRWTSSYKNEILTSRIETAKLLYETLSKIDHQIVQIISASAIGIYPDSFTNYYTEDALEQDQGFLGNVVSKWEAATDDFKKLDIKVVKLRIGLVLSIDGGAYPKIEKPIKHGFGATFGAGKQWQSWIHIMDLAKLFMFAMNQKLEGIYNAVAPNPVSNASMTKEIARHLHEKIILPGIPKFIMKAVLGQMYILLYGSQRVSNKKIQAAGFDFKYKNLSTAIQDLNKSNRGQ